MEALRRCVQCWFQHLAGRTRRRRASGAAWATTYQPHSGQSTTEWRVCQGRSGFPSLPSIGLMEGGGRPFWTGGITSGGGGSPRQAGDGWGGSTHTRRHWDARPSLTASTLDGASRRCTYHGPAARVRGTPCASPIRADPLINSSSFQSINQSFLQQRDGPPMAGVVVLLTVRRDSINS